MEISVIKSLLERFSSSRGTMHPNLLEMENNSLKMNGENAMLFNTLVKYCEENNYHTIKWTKSGGIAKGKKVFIPPAYGIKTIGKTTVVLVLTFEGKFYRFTFGIARAEQKEISGYASFKAFKRTCEKYDINIDDYAIDNGEEYKEDFPNPYRELYNERFADKVIENVHHIDLNSSFMSGLAMTYPEFKPVVEELYSKRKEDEIYKAILTHTYGYLQSELVNYKYILLSKAMVDYNNAYLDSLKDKLLESGRIVLAYNSDGIWYKGDIYHDENEGKNIGQYKNDHTNCKIRFRSINAYEYIEDGKYHVALSGITRLDKLLPRSEWSWGDIYNCGDIETWNLKNDRIEYQGEVEYYG